MHCSFIAIGKTGVGKSTFLNLIGKTTNFKTSSNGMKCTKDINIHKFKFEQLTMVAIDSPGICNCEEDDQKNIDKITNFLRQYKYGLNAVAILIDASDYKLDRNLQKLIKYLYNFFGNGNFWFHVCFIVTHCLKFSDEIESLKMSIIKDKSSFHSEILQLIKDICNLDKNPDIPFFFFESRHHYCYPTNESLPNFKNWLKSRDVLKTQNGEMKNSNWQYQEVRNVFKYMDGPKRPIFKFVHGEPKMITVDEEVPYIVHERRVHDVLINIEEWVSNYMGTLDVITFGIARNFRDNKVKKIVQKKVQEINDVEIIKYKRRKKTILSGIYGESQKELKVYYQEKTLVKESYIACWPYDCEPEDIKNKTNPIKINVTFSEPEIITTFFDEKNSILDLKTQSKSIEELKSLL